MKRDFWWSLIVGGFLGLVFSYGLVSILRPMRHVEAAEEKNLQNDDKPYIRMPLILCKEEGFVLLFSIPSDWLGGIKEEKIDNGQFALP